jgi:glycosyltransferase involved in cell wall biosynthesis
MSTSKLKLPPVSVCLLTYNRASVLANTIECLLNQTHADFELIINDDCSTDATAEICEKVARRDSRVRYCRNPSNLRYADNQNAAILRAQHEHVAIVHDSDIYHPSLLEEWTKALLAQPSAAIVFNAVHFLNRERERERTYVHPYAPLVSGRTMFDEMLLMLNSPIFGIVMVRRSRVLAAGPFDPRLKTLADVDMWYRLLLRHDVAYLSEPLYSIAAREVDHHNTYTNWKVSAEAALIYELNWRRRFLGDPASAERVRRMLAASVRKQQRGQLLACVRHLRIPALLEGVRFLRAQPPFGASIASDSVTTWAAIAERLSLPLPEIKTND